MNFKKRKKEFLDPFSGKVMVTAHRGGFLKDWEEQVPENSLPNCLRCIERGIDVIEMDVCQSRDGKLVLMHDPKIGKRTTGEGRTEDWNLQELQNMKLLYKNGKVSEYPVSSLEEVLQALHQKVFIKLHPKFDLGLFSVCCELIDKTRMRDQVFIWMDWRPGDAEHEAWLSAGRDNSEYLNYQHLVNVIDPDELEKAYAFFQPPVIEIEFGSLDDPIVQKRTIKEINERGSRVSAICQGEGIKTAGLGDHISLENPDAGWGKLLDQGITMLQTNRAEELIQFSIKRGQHDMLQETSSD